ncbi:hypothetical protein PCCS19_14000 [Paenibacillus sp. CCS19]|nr:hypothetical protein PCCS19_14000 [Paenibacillus cellulosilyticus]
MSSYVAWKIARPIDQISNYDYNQNETNMVKRSNYSHICQNVNLLAIVEMLVQRTHTRERG